MPGSTGPLIPRRRLGATFRRLREEKDEQLKDTADALLFSTSKLSRIETGVLEPQPRDLRDLLRYYDIENTDLGLEIQTWLTQAADQPWWSMRGFTPAPKLEEYLSHESPAETIEEYLPLFVPGTMQTAEYAAAVLRGLNPRLSAKGTRRLVELRLARREFLDQRPSKPRLVSVVAEEVLHRVVGSPAVMRGQLESLLAELESDRHEFHVVPFEAGIYPAFEGSITIFTYADPRDSSAVAITSVSTTEFSVKSSVVADHRERFDNLSDHWLAPEATRGLIQSLLGSEKFRPER